MRAKARLISALATSVVGLALLLVFVRNVGADPPAVDEIILTASPTSIAASGLTTTTLTATVRYGGVLQDGVPVVFTSTLGVFPNWEQTITVTATQGIAVTWLRSVPASGTVTSAVRASSTGPFTETQVLFTRDSCQGDFTAWTQHAANPVFGQGVDGGPKAYYPSILYSSTAFDGHGDAAYYKMWFGTSGSRTGYAISDDGLDWITVAVPLTDINGYHAQVLYDANGFGGSGYHYKIWYWDGTQSYTITNLRYAESADGISWANSQPVAQSITRPLVTGVSPNWNRGTYGPITVFYNSSGSAAPDHSNLWNNRYVMYYDGTTGAFERVGLGYSADGIFWTRYGDEPVLDSGSDTWGDPAPWDSSYVGAGTVLRDADGAYRFWYSGGTTAMHHGIGYAVSPDGIHWIKSTDNPIFHIGDGVSWRDSRTYTPLVLQSTTRFDGHGTPEQYKMWFTGDDGSGRSIGYATLAPVTLATAATSGSGQSGSLGCRLDQPFVVALRDGCGAPASSITVTFTISSTPSGASGQGLSIISDSTDATGRVSSTLTLGDRLGVYTVTAEADGVSGMPAAFAATAVVDTVTLVASPANITADGLTTTTLTATVRSGGVAVDGVPVVFTSMLGLFANWKPTITVTTAQGVAVTALRSAPSSATVTSTVQADATDAFTETQVTFTPSACQTNLTAWTEHGDNPVFDPPGTAIAWSNATGLYDADQFSGHGPAAYYRIWYSNGAGSLHLITSANGIDWTAYGSATVASGLTSPDHPAVKYYTDGFTGMNSGANPSSATMYYRIWYWRQGIIYSINAIRYAESPDGLDWYNDQAITQDATRRLIDGASATDWNRGSYGPVETFYNASGSLDHDSVWANKFVMYYEGTNGGTEETGLAYSDNGVHWYRYGPDEPVLGRSTSGWDNDDSAYGTVLRDSNSVYHYWYNGQRRPPDPGLLYAGGIGYAISPDGIHWVKSLDNPIFHVNDGVGWRDKWTYAPFVLYSSTRFDGHGSPVQYKMWFSGKDGSDNEAVGYATLNPVSLSTADTSGSGQGGTVGEALGQPFVVALHDTCGGLVSDTIISFAISGAPAGATGESLSVMTGTTNSSGLVSTTLTLGSRPGLYTVTAQADGVSGLPTIFTATAAIGPATVVILAPATATVTAGDVVTYTTWATDAHGNGWDAAEASYAVEPGAGGSWAANTYTSQAAGTWTVTTTVDGASDNAALAVLRAPAAVVTLSPATATVTAGDAMTYTTSVTDACGNGWDATTEASYAVEDQAGGSWASNIYTTQFAGTWTVTATVDGIAGTASLTVDPPSEPPIYFIYLPLVQRNYPAPLVVYLPLVQGNHPASPDLFASNHKGQEHGVRGTTNRKLSTGEIDLRVTGGVHGAGLDEVHSALERIK